MSESEAQYESQNAGAMARELNHGMLAKHKGANPTSDDIFADAYAVATDQPTGLTITPRHRREVKFLMRLLHVYMEEFRKLERKNERLKRKLAKKK